MHTFVKTPAELAATLPGLSEDQARELLDFADRHYRGDVGTPAEVIATSRSDLGELLSEALWHITRPGKASVYKVERIVVDEPKRPMKPLGPDDAPHCRTHIQFRSDCEQCVSAREFG